MYLRRYNKQLLIFGILFFLLCYIFLLQGGAIMFANGAGTIISCAFVYNSGNLGSAILSMPSGSVIIVDTLFQNNGIGNTGGNAIYHSTNYGGSLAIINPHPSSQIDPISGSPSSLLKCSSGTTTACKSSTAQTCNTTTYMAPNKWGWQHLNTIFQMEYITCTYDNSCSAISVPNAVCNNCFDSHCIGIASCTNGKFDNDGFAYNGCESSVDCNAIDIDGATCTACSDATTCTAMSLCSLNRFDLNGLTSDGCEIASCPILLYSDDAALSGMDGYNVLTESCIMGYQFSTNANAIPSGKTLKIKKDPVVVGDLVMFKYLPSVNTKLYLCPYPWVTYPSSTPLPPSLHSSCKPNKERHFYVNGGSLLMEGITLKGGIESVSYFYQIIFNVFFFQKK